MIRWSTGTELAFHLGVLGQAAYLANPARRLVGTWTLVILVLVPYLVLLFFRHGELSDRAVAVAHLLGALWYLTLTLVVAALAGAGYRPEGWILFLVFMAPGAAISLSLVHRRFQGPPSSGIPARE